METDISDNVRLANGKANPFGWSVYDIVYKGRKVCQLYCGFPEYVQPGFRVEVEELEPGKKRLRAWTA